MPVKVRKLPRKGNHYRVYDGKKVVAKDTTKEKADAQVRLLLGISHGMRLKRGRR